MTRTTGTTWTRDVDGSGSFQRRPTTFRAQLDGAPFAAAPGRYHLYVSHACPWAHRTLIARALKGLDDAITVDVVHPLLDQDGWSFATTMPGATGDRVHQRSRLREVYLAADSDYEGRITVPVLYDKSTDTIVNNESSEILRILDRAFDTWAERPGLRLCPDHLRARIDEVNDWVYEGINNGVYRCGFAQSQSAYDDAIEQVVSAMERAEELLGTQRWLAGDVFTEADVRLFTTLVRFDPVYVTHFKVDRRRVIDHPHIWAYTREIIQHPLVAATVHMQHIRDHYFRSHTSINPHGIVPAGPLLGYDLAHDRDALGGQSLQAFVMESR